MNDIRQSLIDHQMNCTAAEYHAHPALSAGQLLSWGLWSEDEGAWTPRREYPPIGGDALDFGTLVHAGYYEPDTLPGRYACRPLTEKGRLVACDTKQYLEWASQNEGKIHIHPKDEPRVHNCVKAIHDAPAMQIYKGIEVLSTETPYMVQCPVTDFWLRIKPDRLRLRKNLQLINEDAKTAEKSAPIDFFWHAKRLGYFRRGAFYCYALSLITGIPVEDIRYIMIAVESEEPHRVGVYDASIGSLAEAHLQNMVCLREMRRCIDAQDYTPAWEKAPQVIG